MLKRIKEKIINVYHSTVLLLLLAVAPVSAEAATITIETIINKVTTYLQGGVARGAGLLAIIGAGYLTLFAQKMPKENFMYILIGLGVIFGGSSLYNAWVG